MKFLQNKFFGCLILIIIILFIIVFILYILFINDIKPIPTVVDRSLFGQTDCHFPCWNGLIVGESDLNYILEEIRTIDFVSTINFHQDTEGDKTIIRWWQPSFPEQNRLILRSGRLRMVHIFPLVEFTLETVLDIYGEPEAVSSRLEYDQYRWINANLYFFYPQIGTVFHFRTPSTRNGLHLIDDSITGISYFLYTPTDTLFSFFDNMRNAEAWEIEIDNITDWNEIALPFIVVPNSNNSVQNPILVPVPLD